MPGDKNIGGCYGLRAERLGLPPRDGLSWPELVSVDETYCGAVEVDAN
jgi:hypothetical protein